MSNLQKYQRPLNSGKLEHSQSQKTKINTINFQQEQLNNSDKEQKLEIESTYEENIIQNPNKKKILRKELRQKNKISHTKDQHNQNQIIFIEEEIQTQNEMNQKNLQKPNFKVKTETKSLQNQHILKVQEMEQQLKVLQYEIATMKQTQSKEFEIFVEQQMKTEFKTYDFKLTQFIQLMLSEQMKNQVEILENQIEKKFKSHIYQKQNDHTQLKQQYNFDSETLQNKILKLLQQDLNQVQSRNDQTISQLATKLNQIISIQETFQKDLYKLQEQQKNALQQNRIQEVQINQITVEQVSQITNNVDEKIREITTFIDHHLNTFQATELMDKTNFKSEIKEIINKIKIELQQQQEKMYDELKVQNRSSFLQLTQLKEEFHNFKLILQQQQNNDCTDQSKQQQEQNNNKDNCNKIESKNSQQKIIIKVQEIQDQIFNIKYDLSRYQQIKKYINILYDESSRKRDTQKEFQYYLRKIQSDEELFEYYKITTFKQQVELRNYCCQFRQVRGDGNCFYSAFGFQYLELLIRFAEGEFHSFKNLIFGKFNCEINYQNFRTNQIPNFSNNVIFEFIYRIQKLRQITDLKKRQQALEQQFAAHTFESEEVDGCFYGIVIIFFRSLSNYLFQNSDMYQAISDNNNILIWEQEFNSTELIISELAQFLKIHVQLLFFEKNEFKVQEYQQQNQDKIILLIRPGHYNIGIQ